MKKLAIFVEGLTERLLSEYLVREIAGRHRVRIRVDNASERFPRRIDLVSEDPDTGQLGYVLIRNCGADNKVASDVRDEYGNLVSSGYTKIIGIRDLYPLADSDILVLLGSGPRSLNYHWSPDPRILKWIIAVMEIEAWFLAEHTHFERIHTDLTPARIHRELGFDPRTEDMEARPHPSDDLHAAYKLVGFAYRKKGGHFKRTINALSPEMLYLGLPAVKQLQLLITEIDDFVTAISPPMSSSS